TIAMFPFFSNRVFDDGPTMDGLTLLLVCQHRGSQSPPACVFCSGVRVVGKRLHYPARTRLPASRPFFNDAEILVNVLTSYVRTTQALTRQRKQLVQD